MTAESPRGTSFGTNRPFFPGRIHALQVAEGATLVEALRLRAGGVSRNHRQGRPPAAGYLLPKQLVGPCCVRPQFVGTCWPVEKINIMLRLYIAVSTYQQ